jgi:hypothetical protein
MTAVDAQSAIDIQSGRSHQRRASRFPNAAIHIPVNGSYARSALVHAYFAPFGLFHGHIQSSEVRHISIPAPKKPLSMVTGTDFAAIFKFTEELQNTEELGRNEVSRANGLIDIKTQKHQCSQVVCADYNMC